jgi:hypothetical protein
MSWTAQTSEKNSLIKKNKELQIIYNDGTYFINMKRNS